MLCSFFFFKQKTAYEMRISDWSSDVCSSDLIAERGIARAEIVERQPNAQAAQLVEYLERPGIGVDEHAFGDFQFQPPRLQPALRESGYDRADEADRKSVV